MSPFNQKGFAPLIIVLIVGLLLASAGGGAYYFLKKQPTSQVPQATPIASASASLVPHASVEVTKIAGCQFEDTDLCKGLSNYGKIMSHKLIQKTDSEVRELTVNLEEKKARMSSYNVKNELISDNIFTDKTEYRKDPVTQKWKQYDYQSTESSMFDTVKTDNQTTYYPKADEVNITKEQESCGELTCFKFEFTNKYSDIKVVLWFDNEKYLTQKMVIKQNQTVVMDDTYNYKDTFISIPEEKDIISQ